MQVAGEGGTDTIIVNGTTSADSFVVNNQTVTFNGIAISETNVQAWTLNGLGGNDTLTIASTPSAVPLTFNGGGDSGDTLIGPSEDSTWNITSASGGSLGNLTWSGVANLTGGSGNNTFAFQSGGSVSGVIDGGEGTNTLDYSGNGGAAITVNLATATAPNIQGGYQNIQSIVGSSATTDTLIGPGTNSTWQLTGTDSGTIGSIAFSSIENLTGGSGNDTFSFLSKGAVSQIDGGGGTNELDYSQFINGVSVNLATGLATATSTIKNIQMVLGSAGNDTLTGGASASTLSGDGGIDTLNGGSGNTTILVAINQRVGTVVTGGSGTTTLVGSARSNAWNISGSNMGALNGITFSGVQNLTGGTRADQFIFQSGGSISGSIVGGGIIEVLDYSNLTTGVTVNLTTGKATGVGGGITNITSVIGSTGNDHLTGGTGSSTLDGHGGTDVLLGGTGNTTFVIATKQATGTTITGGSGTNTLDSPSSSSIWQITGANAGTLNGVAFTSVQNLTGGGGANTFMIGPKGTLSGTIDGGSGSGILNYSADGAAAITVNLQSSTASDIGGFADIQTLVGSSSTSDKLIGPDTFNLWQLTGANAGTVNSTFSFSSIENLTGGSANDVYSLRREHRSPRFSTEPAATTRSITRATTVQPSP